jgi:phage I-like protein
MISPSISSLIDRQLAKHPMMVAAQSEINKLRETQAKACATKKVDDAIREGRLLPSQRDWAIEYCSADDKGFDKFIGAQPKIISNGSDNTFTARIGEPPQGEASLSSREVEICANLGLESKEQLEKFAANKDRWTLKFPRPRLMLDDTNSGKADAN